MDDQQESDSGTWDRVARGLPVLVAGDGLGLWQSTHRDDCALEFRARIGLEAGARDTFADCERAAPGATAVRIRRISTSSSAPSRSGFEVEEA